MTEHTLSLVGILLRFLKRASAKFEFLKFFDSLARKFSVCFAI